MNFQKELVKAIEDLLDTEPTLNERAKVLLQFAAEELKAGRVVKTEVVVKVVELLTAFASAGLLIAQHT